MIARVFAELLQARLAADPSLGDLPILLQATEQFPEVQLFDVEGLDFIYWTPRTGDLADHGTGTPALVIR